MSDAVETRTRIQKLWDQLATTEPESEPYEALVEKIHSLSEEYKVLINAEKKPKADAQSGG